MSEFRLHICLILFNYDCAREYSYNFGFKKIYFLKILCNMGHKCKRETYSSNLLGK